MPFIPWLQRVRGNPLGSGSLNYLRQNVLEIEALRQVEHATNGKHNAREVPPIIGHINGTTGYLFDTAFGGGTITQPATGTTAISVVSGVFPYVTTPIGTQPADAQVLANVSDADIANTPHIISVEPISATEVRTYIKRLDGSLGGAGNTWVDVDRAHDIALFAPAVDALPPGLQSFSLFSRGDYLYDTPERWNAFARDQHALNLRLIEHRDDGSHKTPRIPFAQGWCRPIAGPAYDLADGDGVASVAQVSTGIVDVTTTRVLSDINLGMCFPEGRPANDGEVVIVNGRATSINTFRFYVYVGRLYPILVGPPGFKWEWHREDRAFNFSIHGDVTT